MDWFHCNQCFVKTASAFAVSSCGHICCEACIKSSKCSVCGASCTYLPITDEMKPQEKVFFKDPVKLIKSRLEHISQVCLLSVACTPAPLHLSELKRENAVLEKQLSQLKMETAELQKPLSQRRVSLPKVTVSSNANFMVISLKFSVQFNLHTSHFPQVSPGQFQTNG
uniref:Uncharacterized protein n=1 Tax=Mastacembelus armatus TaxID=205130 RepID=A0A3Q3M5U9_9TELE